MGNCIEKYLTVNFFLICAHCVLIKTFLSKYLVFNLRLLNSIWKPLRPVIWIYFFISNILWTCLWFNSIVVKGLQINTFSTCRYELLSSLKILTNSCHLFCKFLLKQSSSCCQFFYKWYT